MKIKFCNMGGVAKGVRIGDMLILDDKYKCLYIQLLRALKSQAKNC